MNQFIDGTSEIFEPTISKANQSQAIELNEPPPPTPLAQPRKLAPTKDEKSTVIKLGVELSATQADEPIDSLVEIDGLVSEQDFQLWQ